MMYIVKTNHNSHSVWNSLTEAEKQKGVLEENGYKKVDIESFNATNNCENGHYFV